MKINIDGPYREKRGLAQELRAYIMIAKIIAITAILLIGIHTVNQLDDIMAAQRIQDKTLTDAMDQLMWIRQDILILEEQICILEDDVEALKPEITNSSAYPLTPKERDLIERIVASEARGEPIDGMAAVAQCIRDRSTDWGMTIEEVCFDPGQFGEPHRGEISPEVVQAVAAIFDEGMNIYDGGAYQFHDTSVSPYWTKGKIYRGAIGDLRFYGGYEE